MNVEQVEEEEEFVFIRTICQTIHTYTLSMLNILRTIQIKKINSKHGNNVYN